MMRLINSSTAITWTRLFIWEYSSMCGKSLLTFSTFPSPRCPRSWWWPGASVTTAQCQCVDITITLLLGTVIIRVISSLLNSLWIIHMLSYARMTQHNMTWRHMMSVVMLLLIKLSVQDLIQSVMTFFLLINCFACITFTTWWHYLSFWSQPCANLKMNIIWAKICHLSPQGWKSFVFLGFYFDFHTLWWLNGRMNAWQGE